MLKIAKKELVKYLPKVAQEQWQPIYDAIATCFDTYEGEVTQRVKDDIQGRKEELKNLVQLREKRQIHRDTELTRLHQFETDISQLCRNIEGCGL